jgi:small conductance mechanosensitive channel
MPDLYQYSDQVVDFFFLYGLKLLGAIIILVLGLWAINRINAFIFRLMTQKNVDESLRPFLKNIIGITLRVLLLIMVIAQLGIPMTSFIAIIGSIGLAIGLALQGSLSNFAGGVLILTIKPFRVGDFIEAQGQMGTVKIINIFNTVLKTGDNKTIYLPNGPLASSVVVNYTVEPTRRVELLFTVSVDNNIGTVRQILQGLINSDERVLQEPASAIVVTNFAEHALTISARVWVKREDYWSFFWDMNERVKAAFEEHNIAMPVPRREMVASK